MVGSSTWERGTRLEVCSRCSLGCWFAVWRAANRSEPGGRMWTYVDAWPRAAERLGRSRHAVPGATAKAIQERYSKPLGRSGVNLPTGHAFLHQSPAVQWFQSLGAVHVSPRASTRIDLRLGDFLETPGALREGDGPAA